MKEIVFGTIGDGIRAVIAGREIQNKTITKYVGNNKSQDGMQL